MHAFSMQSIRSSTSSFARYLSVGIKYRRSSIHLASCITDVRKDEGLGSGSGLGLLRMASTSNSVQAGDTISRQKVARFYTRSHTCDGGGGGTVTAVKYDVK